MPTHFPVFMPIAFLALILLPIRLSSLQLIGLAFFLWFLGGLILAWRGAVFLGSLPEQPGMAILATVVAAALAVGWAKGRFVLSKTSQRNIERIDAFTEPKRPLQVYGLRSWIIIGVMVLISASLALMPVNGTSLLIRGGVNLAIGTALISSSMAYLKFFFRPLETSDNSST